MRHDSDFVGALAKMRPQNGWSAESVVAALEMMNSDFIARCDNPLHALVTCLAITLAQAMEMLEEKH